MYVSCARGAPIRPRSYISHIRSEFRYILDGVPRYADERRDHLVRRCERRLFPGAASANGLSETHIINI